MKFRLSARAQADIEACLHWSLAEFGEAALTRYQRLIHAAILDVAADPERSGCRALCVNRITVGLYHIRHSRNAVPERGDRVKNPRHLLVFRVIDGEVLEIIRLLHDSMDIETHLS